MDSCQLRFNRIDAGYVNEARELIRERLGLAGEKVMIHSTHIHTGPNLEKEKDKEKLKGWADQMKDMLQC